MSELQGPEAYPGGSNQPDKGDEKDPSTWYGLVWRIVKIAVDSNGNLMRLSILIVLVGAALWLIASVGRVAPLNADSDYLWPDHLYLCLVTGQQASHFQCSSRS